VATFKAFPPTLAVIDLLLLTVYVYPLFSVEPAVIGNSEVRVFPAALAVRLNAGIKLRTMTAAIIQLKIFFIFFLPILP